MGGTVKWELLRSNSFLTFDFKYKWFLVISLRIIFAFRVLLSAGQLSTGIIVN